MKILLVSATFKEIEPTLSFLKIETQSNKNKYTIDFLGHQISVIITGIGSYSMVYWLTKKITEEQFDLVINAGISGSFDENLKIGDVVFVQTETIGDLGVDNNGEFKSLFDEKFVKPNTFPFQNEILVNPQKKHYSILPNIEIVNGLSANTVSGEQVKIIALKDKFDVQVESMEGAAFFYVCLQENVNFVQVRAISNYVKPRNKSEWQIMMAISSLNDKLKLFVFELLK